MLEIKSLDDVHGNNVVIYSIKTLLERKCFPKLSIMAGYMGVGKTSVARVVAKTLDTSGHSLKVYNCGMDLDLSKLQEEVFSMRPMQPRAFLFEELHALQRSDQEALLQMFDSQSDNTYVICTTTDLNKVLRTIRSRAQVWEFKLLSEKQCAQLLDDYLAQRGITLSNASKQSLLRACRGVPRDLIKNTDFAIEGDFDSMQLDALLGNVSDELLFTVFMSLKSSTTDFVLHIEELMEDVASNKAAAMSDYWLRFLLERHGGSQHTLTPEMIEALARTYTSDDINRITKTLLRARADTLLLELISLNMTLTGNTSASVLGTQKDQAMHVEGEVRVDKQSQQTAGSSARVTRAAVKEFKL